MNEFSANAATSTTTSRAAAHLGNTRARQVAIANISRPTMYAAKLTKTNTRAGSGTPQGHQLPVLRRAPTTMMSASGHNAWMATYPSAVAARVLRAAAPCR